MHFYGICFAAEGESVDGLMAPFDENDCRFVDREDEWREEYEGRQLFAVSDDGEVDYVWRHAVYVREDDGWKAEDGWSVKELPCSAYFKTFEDCVHEDKCGVKEGGRWGSFENPQGQYDYYRIGGRWSGVLRAAKGERVDEACWEIREWEKDHPGESWYKDGQYDIAAVDDLAVETQEPYFVVLGGEWLTDLGSFWTDIVQPLIGKGYTAYAIDAHD